MKQYKTIDVARRIGIHVNTVRLYEKCALIPVSYTHLDVYKRQSTVTSNLTALLWIAHTNSIITGIPTRRSGKSMTDYAGNTACL